MKISFSDICFIYVVASKHLDWDWDWDSFGSIIRPVCFGVFKVVDVNAILRISENGRHHLSGRIAFFGAGS